MGDFARYASHAFQSTLSVRRATCLNGTVITYEPISIHALREESDTDDQTEIGFDLYFNPRSP